jgi:hypothetical protein
MTPEQFIVQAIEAARTGKAEGEAYFKAAQKMASDSDIPAELQTLGKVLQKIMLGDTKVDLSVLPSELAAIIKQKLEEQT